MTAEVAILNRQAVALAADSAVTVTGPSGQKVFNTVNKLFTLSKYHPVGIMVYSSAQILGVPVETVIKTFRRKLGRTAFDTLPEYQDAFAEFLTKDTVFFTPTLRERHSVQVAHRVLDDLMLTIGTERQNKYPGWSAVTNAQMREIGERVVERFDTRFAAAVYLNGVDAALIAKTKTLTADLVKRAVATLNQAIPRLKVNSETIQNIAISALLRDIPCNSETGIVIAGFGETDIFPRLRSFQFENSMYGVHKIYEGKKVDIEEGNHSHIAPFAQTEMMETFTEGRTRDFDRKLMRFVDDFIVRRRAAIATQDSTDPMIPLLSSLKEELRSEMASYLREYTREKHTAPLSETIVNMPKEELAVMAEALINLTAIKRRMSPDADTVGGPTDVAIISKGDGFVWIKRKHYFDVELNPQWERNYFQQTQEEGANTK